ncbi:MAG: phosphoglucomutase (alpha-D-glucose-1,6-bisphosphate-dependent) [Calditrichia bacterium]
MLHPKAGQPVGIQEMPHIPRLIHFYYENKPNPAIAEERVKFGTSGHRGSSLRNSFNEPHIAAISQAVAEYRKAAGITGPLFIGMDTHALSEPALFTAIEVLAANGVKLKIPRGLGYTPTPVISHAILVYNRTHPEESADGIVVTPSHNPPEDGGFKYNPPSGGPADTEITQQIEKRANQILEENLAPVKRIPISEALKLESTDEYDYIPGYVNDLEYIIDFEVIREAGIKIGVDPLGGSGIRYWRPIAKKYGLNLQLVSECIDPTFSFMHLDWDGKIRMDCSSPYAMKGLVNLKDRFDIAFGNDPDYDRHGIVTPSAGLMNPNHFLAAAIWYLFQNRPGWSTGLKIGKTLVSSSMIDRIGEFLKRDVVEVPVGFKWFVPGLLNGELGFGGEESAGATFLRKDGTVWTTDKDGIVMDLLAAEMTARLGKDPARLYKELTARFGQPVYRRIDQPATLEIKQALKGLSPSDISLKTLAGEPVKFCLTRAPGNNAEIGGVKIIAENGWFAARPSGTENVYKIYAESFIDENHLNRILKEASDFIGKLV